MKKDVMERYGDIIDLPHHVSRIHPQMAPLDRAAQFAPFKSLTGLGAAMEETRERSELRIEEELMRETDEEWIQHPQEEG